MGYLIITRRTGEKIDITLEDGRQIHIVQLGVSGNQVRYGIDAPRSITVDREEITERKRREQEQQSGKEPNGNKDEGG
jgi:carbon storage regulator